jgi:flagellum-specific peptidoglycan hydrolase FlgJ
MSSSTSSPAPRRRNDRILTIDWSLLWRRMRIRLGQYFSALRFKASRTEYIPPAWMGRFRLSWFRLGLIGLLVFVFTQRQVDFTISMGKEGLAAGATTGRHMAAKANAGVTPPNPSKDNMSVLPVASALTPPEPRKAAWSVNQYEVSKVRAYVNRFQRVARGEEEKYSIPAPAKMALAILGSDAGTNPAARENNNHFGRITANGYYENAWMNWRAHSELIDREFPQLADESVNYQQWIAALAKTSYSRDKELGKKLLKIIEHFKLERL